MLVVLLLRSLKSLHRALTMNVNSLLCIQELKHPNIVELIAAVNPFKDDSESLLVVQELIHGPTLASLLSAQAAKPKHVLYTQGQAAEWLRGVAQALSYMHSSALGKNTSVIHRDVSPSNVMLTSWTHSKSKAKLVCISPALL